MSSGFQPHFAAPRKSMRSVILSSSSAPAPPTLSLPPAPAGSSLLWPSDALVALNHLRTAVLCSSRSRWVLQRQPAVGVETPFPPTHAQLGQPHDAAAALNPVRARNDMRRRANRWVGAPRLACCCVCGTWTSAVTLMADAAPRKRRAAPGRPAHRATARFPIMSPDDWAALHTAACVPSNARKAWQCCFTDRRFGTS